MSTDEAKHRSLTSEVSARIQRNLSLCLGHPEKYSEIVELRDLYFSTIYLAFALFDHKQSNPFVFVYTRFMAIVSTQPSRVTQLYFVNSTFVWSRNLRLACVKHIASVP